MEGPSAIRSTRGWLDAVKYLFVVTIEGCIDAAQHVCASEGWGPPSSNTEVMAVLSDHDVLDRDLAAIAVPCRTHPADPAVPATSPIARAGRPAGLPIPFATECLTQNQIRDRS